MDHMFSVESLWRSVERPGLSLIGLNNELIWLKAFNAHLSSKMRNRLRISRLLKKIACWGHSNMPSCFFFSFFLNSYMIVARDLKCVVLIFNKRCNCMNKAWSWNYQCKKTWDNDACITHTQLKHVCNHINTLPISGEEHRNTLNGITHMHTRTHMHTKAIVSHSAQVVESIKTRHNCLQHNIRIERRFSQLLYASPDPSFTSKSKPRDLVVSRSWVLAI